jgi:GTPase SAR1 family protein
MTIDEQLKSTRKKVSNIAAQIRKIKNENMAFFLHDTKLMSEFERFFVVYNETLAKLDNPTLTIATVGTTNSGKSTIVNALIGRDVAPIERGEMSAGILTFSQSNKSELIIEESQDKNKLWSGGSYTGLGDLEMKEKIKKIFIKYHHEKDKHNNCTAPKIEVKGDLLWNKYPQIIDLPENIKVKFIDLPGLLAAGDGVNLGVIREVLHGLRPVCILAINYEDTTRPEDLKILLNEINTTVTALKGSCESILFLLNKVDSLILDGNNEPLDNVLEKL